MRLGGRDSGALDRLEENDSMYIFLHLLIAYAVMFPAEREHNCWSLEAVRVVQELTCELFVIVHLFDSDWL